MSTKLSQGDVSEARITRTLILFPGALGDFICFLPTLNHIASYREVDLLARTEFSDIAPARVRTQSLERFEIRRLFVRNGAGNTEVKNFFADYAYVYSWTGSGHPLFEQQLKSICPGTVRVFPFRLPDRQMHQADYYLSCLTDAQSLSVAAIELRWEFAKWGGEFWRAHGLGAKPVLALAPGSGAPQKNWPVASFHAVAEWWRKRLRGVVLVVLGPVEEERGGYDALCDDAVVVRNERLGRIAALLSCCNVYLGNDSGVTHLAGALGIPTVALFGPSDPLQWASRGSKVHILTANVGCSPCMDNALKSCSHRRCLSALNPSQVFQKLEELAAVDNLTPSSAKTRVSAKSRPERQTATAGKTTIRRMLAQSTNKNNCL